MNQEFLGGSGGLKAALSMLSVIIGILVVGQANANDAEFDKLLRLVDQRLQVMDDVALYKFANGIPIENKKREEVVLASAIANAAQHQLKPVSVEAFFGLQIQLAKQVQKGWIDQWREEGKKPKGITTDIPDLKSDIRPKLINLGEQIVRQFPLALAALHDPAQQAKNSRKIEQAIASPFISIAMKHKLLDAMAMIQTEGRHAQNQLREILQAGVLRVGTTGDYKPFSYIQSNHQFAGIDIEMAKDLADSLGVKLQLVKTSWPTLMADLAADRFDVGMSGISRSLKRRRSAFFSDQYAIGGKTSIGRCDEVNQLDSFKEIDQPGVRIIVNPGGTNQKFVRGNIKKAQVVVYPDNTTIFEQIRDGHADIMITDDIEVKLQQKLHPTLCATMPNTLLTYTEKGYLLPQDIALKEYLDGWLQQVKHNGKLKLAFARYLK